MQDFLFFRKMVTPMIIQVVFWIGVVGVVVSGLISLVAGIATKYGGGPMVFSGLMMIVLGPIVVRIYCELLIVIFSINDNLNDIRNSLKDRSPL